jgi:hypothetical protein
MGFLGLLVVFALGLSACGGDDVVPVPVDSPDLLRCDVTSASCQLGIYNSVALALDAEGFGIPRIRTISVDQHAEEVRNGIDLNDLTGEDPESRGLRLLGFLPPTVDSLTEAQTDYFINNVAAYYSRGGRSITIIDRDYEPGDAQVILAHEFVHAIQDSQFNLNTVSSGAATEDGIIGVRSVIEGDAMYSSFDWYFGLMGTQTSRAAWDDVLVPRIDRLRERVADPEIALLDTASSFPYAYGFRYMTDVSLAGALEARAGAFLQPPLTAAEVIAGAPDPAVVLDLPGAVHPAPLDGALPTFEDRAGAWYVYGFLVREGLGDDEAWAAAQGWIGDEFAIYEAGDEVAAVWRVRFADAEGAMALTDRVNGADGPVARSAVPLGDDVYVFGAETSESLVAWAAQPLDEMTATALVLDKSAAHGGGFSSGGCLLPVEFASLPSVLRHSH